MLRFADTIGAGSTAVQVSDKSSFGLRGEAGGDARPPTVVMASTGIDCRALAMHCRRRRLAARGWRGTNTHPAEWQRAAG